ncbi:MAG: glycosyltransferase family 2 protein [Elusimicrobiota bacterium]|nr:glycosyltransferase family 2 protein [Endomicrobiia bacterium]MDW8055346.1 glycosyltransferase family 2 protein [Elusimicrobiota bacterium]MDW8166445.1 glycosyltransferase family 2 protein [Elusimicrobiota bacterium]
MKELSVIIPVYNEEKSIINVLSELLCILSTLKLNCYEIIVINDGSTDNTVELIKSSKLTNIKLISHPVNIGYGQAILTGIKNAQYNYIATIDADGSYLAEDLARLCEEIGEFDLVIGARQGKEFWGSLIKHPARLIFLWLAEFTVGQKIPDVNSGLRVFKKSSFERVSLPVLCRGFSFSSTMTLAFLAEGMFVKFVPIKYLPRKGKSKVNYIKDTLRTLQALVEVITFYNPLKIIVLLCVPSIILFIISIFLWVYTNSIFWINFGFISLYVTIIIFTLGLLIDMIRLKK